MSKLFNKIIVKRRSLIFDEYDMTKVFGVIHKHEDPWFICRPNMDVGNCGWKDRTKWFVHFNASNAAWLKITNDLNVVRVWQCRDIPKNSIGKVYSED